MSGFIECNELEAVLKTLGVTLTPEQVRCVFKAADLNGNSDSRQGQQALGARLCTAVAGCASPLTKPQSVDKSQTSCTSASLLVASA